MESLKNDKGGYPILVALTTNKILASKQAFQGISTLHSYAYT